MWIISLLLSRPTISNHLQPPPPTSTNISTSRNLWSPQHQNLFIQYSLPIPWHWIYSYPWPSPSPSQATPALTFVDRQFPRTGRHSPSPLANLLHYRPSLNPKSPSLPARTCLQFFFFPQLNLHYNFVFPHGHWKDGQPILILLPTHKLYSVTGEDMVSAQCGNSVLYSGLFVAVGVGMGEWADSPHFFIFAETPHSLQRCTLGG